MRIKKNKLVEHTILEAEDNKDLSVINPQENVDEIADDLQDQIEVVTDGEVISDDSAIQVATEIKQVGDELDAGQAVVVSDDAPLGVENAITKILDSALSSARKSKRRGIKTGSNVLIIGLPGSGKTASIMDWKESRGINLVSINAKNNDLEAYINGYTVRDTENPNKVKQAFSDNLRALDKPNSVLFLDEYNRQVKPHIRASLYTLINEHKIVGDGPDGLYEFKNLLFTIAAINPAIRTDKGAAPLNDAELSRFLHILTDFNSEISNTIEYIQKQYDAKIAKLDPTDEYYLEDLEDYLRIQDLGIFVLSHQDFGYDEEEDLEDLAGLQRKMLNQRAFTEALAAADGRVEKLRFWVENTSGLLEKDKEKLSNILDDYVIPSFEDLCDAKGINIKTGEIKHEEPVDNADIYEDEAYDEDEDEFFTTSNTGKLRAKNPYEVETAIDQVISDWSK